MPNNRIIYFGVVLLVATALLWIGTELTKRIEWLLPYLAGASVLLIVSGFVQELWQRRNQRR
jgi:hypothetical protein